MPKLLTALLLASAAMAGPALAQDHDHGHDGGGAPHGSQPLAHAPGPPPASGGQAPHMQPAPHFGGERPAAQGSFRGPGDGRAQPAGAPGGVPAGPGPVHGGQGGYRGPLPGRGPDGGPGGNPGFPTGPGPVHGGQGGYRGPLPGHGPDGGPGWQGDPGDRGNPHQGGDPRWHGQPDHRIDPNGRGGPGWRGDPGHPPPPGFAGDPGRRGGGWNPGWRDDHRYDWRGWRDSHRDAFRVGQYYAPRGYGWGYRRFSIGAVIAPAFFAQDYWIDDPYDYRLPPAYGPYRWVRYYNDALLVDVYSGQVVDVIPDFFW